jgi:hypothetical protein
VQLAQQIGGIISGAVAEAIALNGAALDVIRQNRMDKYAVTQSYLRDERARIGQ